MSEPEVDLRVSTNKTVSRDSQSRLSGSFIAAKGTPSLASRVFVKESESKSGNLLRSQDCDSIMQVQEASDAQDFLVICKNSPPDTNCSQLLHDNSGTDSELSSREVTFR
jgi:hypothetical protein